MPIKATVRYMVAISSSGGLAGPRPPLLCKAVIHSGYSKLIPCPMLSLALVEDMELFAKAAYSPWLFTGEGGGRAASVLKGHFGVWGESAGN